METGKYKIPGKQKGNEILGPQVGQKKATNTIQSDLESTLEANFKRGPRLQVKQ